ncbi:Hint domain-containing protein [Tropicimonas marinistellae]|uniref:Hint domain-containing protein n=1 Tax=Tropicimonas marinistellae TaxID=1739787 RepID=UPI00083536D2|nr:Hint domain-containing protein [Tropicimonas marinistellae]
MDHDLPFLTLASMSTSASSGFNGSPGGWHLYGATITIEDDARLTALTVNDTDSTFDDDDSDGSQTLGADITIDGTTYPAGTVVENEYAAIIGDWGGPQYRILAVSVAGDASNIIGFVFPDGLPPTGTYNFLFQQDGQSDPYDGFPPVCFTPGTMILTPDGERRVETLKSGDLVVTQDHGIRPIRIVAHRRIDFRDGDTRFKPIQIRAGALGNGLPTTDLVVSPHHRMLMRNPQGHDTLVAAKSLVGRPGIRVMRGKKCVHYLHLIFDAHEIVFSNGTPSESLLPGPQALRSVPPEVRNELLTIFPQLKGAHVRAEHLSDYALLRVSHARRIAHLLEAPAVRR